MQCSQLASSIIHPYSWWTHSGHIRRKYSNIFYRTEVLTAMCANENIARVKYSIDCVPRNKNSRLHFHREFPIRRTDLNILGKWGWAERLSIFYATPNDNEWQCLWAYFALLKVLISSPSIRNRIFNLKFYE